jgi:hypothetical protein
MDDRGGILKLTRRGFVGTAGAAMGAAIISSARASEFSSLLVETIYLPKPGGGEYLAGIRLRLRNRDSEERSLTFRGSDFVSLDSAAPPKVRLSGLVQSFRDAAQPVPEDTVLKLTIAGVDLFNHLRGNVGGPCTYVFTISADVHGEDDAKTVVWQIGLRTNVWIHHDLFHWNDFPPAGLGGKGTVALADVMDGSAGFKLELGAGWITETLSRIVGQEIAAFGVHVAALGVLPDATGHHAENPREWRWSVRPIYASSRLSTYADVLEFRSLRFGWGKAPAEEPEEVADAPPKSQFTIELGDQPPLPRRALAAPALLAAPDGRARLPETRFAIRSEQNSYLSLTGFGVQATWETLERDGKREGHGARVAELTLAGDFVASLVSGGVTLGTMKYVVVAGSPELGLRADENGRWLLQADLVPTPDSQVFELDHIRAESVADNLVRSDDQARHFLSLGLGWLALRLPSVKAPATTKGPTPGVRLMASLPAGRVKALALRAPLAELPATLAPDGEKMFSRVAVVDPGIHPVLRLRSVELPSGLDEAEAGRAGHILLDAPFAGADGVPVLDLPLDSAMVEVRRASDMLLLDFRLANLRLRSGPHDGAFLIYPDPIAKPADLVPVDYPKEAVLRADFAPQHMAEQAFLRRDAAAGGLPALDFQKLAELVGGNWPAQVRRAFDILRSGTRQMKRIERQVPLRNLANKVADVLKPDWKPGVGEDEKIKDRLNHYDSLLTDRVNDFLAFALVYDKAAVRSWPIEVDWLPEDQTIYAGPDDLDPDAASLAWDLRQNDLLVIRRAKLIERLISVDGSYLDDPKVFPNYLSMMGGSHPEILDLTRGTKTGIATTLRFVPASPDASIVALIKGKWSDPAAQRSANSTKARLAADYAEFRARWQREAEAFRSRLSEDDFEEIANFASARWALVGRSENEPVAQLMRRVVEGMVDLTGDFDEPFPERSRARFSGPSRLAFRWSRRHDPAGEPATEVPFALAELLDWQRRDQMVTLRARTVREEDARGKLIRTTDYGEQLRLQGFEPAPDLLARSWMDRVYAMAATPPLDYETAIELPFRLQLSPAQNPVWVMPHRVDLDLTFGEDPVPPVPGQPLWSIALEPRNPDPLLPRTFPQWPESAGSGGEGCGRQRQTRHRVAEHPGWSACARPRRALVW